MSSDKASGIYLLSRFCRVLRSVRVRHAPRRCADPGGGGNGGGPASGAQRRPGGLRRPRSGAGRTGGPGGRAGVRTGRPRSAGDRRRPAGRRQGPRAPAGADPHARPRGRSSRCEGRAGACGRSGVGPPQRAGLPAGSCDGGPVRPRRRCAGGRAGVRARPGATLSRCSARPRRDLAGACPDHVTLCDALAGTAMALFC